MEITVNIQPTPNPNALKFVLNHPVKSTGNSSYRSPIECIENPFATSIFTIRGVDQVHLFENVVTITKFGYEDWEEMIPVIEELLKNDLPNHDPNYYDPDPEEERRRSLPPELKKIEEILDKTIRPGLQGDGGDIQTVSIEDNVLIVQYQGACGTCPSATGGTLEAIKGILREEYNPEIDVYIAPAY